MRSLRPLLACLLLAGCAKPQLEPGTARLDAAPLPAVQAPVSPPVPTLSSTLQITGKPAVLAVAGAEYSFAPMVGATNEPVSFSIINRPAWATLDMSTGVLRGTPRTEDVGFYGPITLVATNSQAQGSFGPFTIEVRAAEASPSPVPAPGPGTDPGPTPPLPDPTVVTPPSPPPTPAPDSGPPSRPPGAGVAVLTWTAPLEYTDGRPLQDLAGYRIYQGDSPATLRLAQEFREPGRVTFTAGNLTSGTHYFAVTAFTAAGAESAFSNIGSKQIP